MSEPHSEAHESEAVSRDVRDRLQADPRLDLQRRRIELDVAGGVVTLSGEVPDIAIKRQIVRQAAEVPGVVSVRDEIRVAPAVEMGDREILAHLTDLLLAEPALADIAITTAAAGRQEKLRDPVGRQRGSLDIGVEQGVVVLEGEMPSWAHARLAGVLAWWVPGTRDVVLRLRIEPPEQDNDGEIADAVRIALEKDPLVDATQVRVRCHQAIVLLTGLVSSEAESQLAEHDAWYVHGVRGVNNRIEVRPVAVFPPS